MTSPGYGRQVDLDDGAALRLADARGTTLHVMRGRLWLTQDRDLRDIVLSAGDTWTIERNGLSIATAQADSSVAVIGPGAAGIDARGRRLTWDQRAIAWLERLDAARVRQRGVPYF